MKILFVCYANACRSQIAEAYGRWRAPEGVEIQSAGLIAAGVWPLARRAAEDRGLTMDGQWSKTLDEVSDQDFDLIVSLSGKARPHCDNLATKIADRTAKRPRREHWPILDPAGVTGTDEQLREVFALCVEDIAEEVDVLYSQLFPDTPVPSAPARGS